MSRLQWIGQSSRARSVNADSLTCINFYVEAVESQQGKAALVLYPTPGLQPFATLTGSGGGVRGLHTAANGRLFGVCGNTFSEISANGTAEVQGTLLTGTGPVSMADNGLTVIVVDGPYAYTYTYATDTFAQIVDVDFMGASHVGFLDGYYLFLRPNTQQFYWSGLYASTIDALDIASAEGNPDLLVALLVAHREIWLFGTQTTEIWYSSGEDPPFARLQGALLEQGCLAPASPAVVGDSLFWLAQNQHGFSGVMEAQGTQPRRVSTHALEQEWQRYGRMDDAIGWGYQNEGHGFYWLLFPTAQKTYVYDQTAQLWHQCQGWDIVNGISIVHRAACHAFAHGKHVVGDYFTGQVYILNPDVYTDNGVPIVRQLTLPPVVAADSLGRIIHNRLQIDIEAGVGLDGDVRPGTDPRLLVSYSDDSAHTFTPGQWVSLGQIGEYQYRAILRRLGAPHDRRYRLETSDPVKIVILGAILDYEGILA